MVRWLATKIFAILVGRIRWVSRLATVFAVVRWLVNRRRSSAVVRLRRHETLVVGVDKAAHRTRKGSRDGH